MKKKETLWELLKRLDDEAGQFNFHLHQANRSFDNAAMTTKKVLEKHEKELHRIIRKIKKPLKSVMDQLKKASKKNNNNK
jgi:hypothetical protein